MLTKEKLTEMNKAVIHLHQNRETRQMCRQFLTDLSDFIDYKVGAFVLSASQTSEFGNDPILLKSFYDRSFEEMFAADMRKYAEYDYLNWLLSSSESFVYKDSEIVKQDLRLSSRYYTEVLKKNDLIHACGAIIVNNGKFAASLALYNDSQSGDFDDDDLFILDYFLPHLEQALEPYCKQIEEQSNPVHILKERLNLTEREIEIVRLVIEGYTNKEISEMLSVQTNTIKKHIYNIFIKFDVSSRTQLFRYILQNGLLELFIPLEK